MNFTSEERRLLGNVIDSYLFDWDKFLTDKRILVLSNLGYRIRNECEHNHKEVIFDDEKGIIWQRCIECDRELEYKNGVVVVKEK